MPRALGRGRGSMRRGRGETVTDTAKGKQKQQNRRGNRDVGCSIIHGLIKDAQAPALSAGFWPLYRGNSSTPILAPAADPVSQSWGGWRWGRGTGGKGPSDPCTYAVACPSCDLSLYFSCSFLSSITSVSIQIAQPHLNLDRASRFTKVGQVS